MGFRNTCVWVGPVKKQKKLASIFPFVSPFEIQMILEAKRILKSPASICRQRSWKRVVDWKKKGIINLFGRKGLTLASFLGSNYIDTLVLSISGKYIAVLSSLHVDKSKTHQLFKCFPHCVLFSFVKPWCSVPTGPRCLLCSRHFDWRRELRNHSDSDYSLFHETREVEQKGPEVLFSLLPFLCLLLQENKW